MRQQNNSEFSTALMREIKSNLNNWYGEDNWDIKRFGTRKNSLKDSILDRLHKTLPGKFFNIIPGKIGRQLKKVPYLKKQFDGLSALYMLLDDEYSKSVLISVLAYRIMGFRKIKLFLNTPSYWSERDLIFPQNSGHTERLGKI